jgi:thioredoxin 1
MTKHLKVEEFNELVLNSDKPVLIDFYAAWCAPCKMLAPTIEKISENNPDVNVYKVNVDEQGQLAQKYGVMSIPTLISFKNGKIHKQAMGFMPESKVLDLLK